MARPLALDHNAFDERQFEALRSAFKRGELAPQRAVLAAPPRAIEVGDGNAPLRLEVKPQNGAHIAQMTAFRAAGRSAIRAGRAALLLMAGGMATRFGGGAKAAVPLQQGHPETFLSYALDAARRVGLSCGGEVPVVVMTSFATRAAVDTHLEQIDWAGLPTNARLRFEQSILPRLDAEGRPLFEDPRAADWPDTLTCAAPGHGDTLGRLGDSGILDQLRARGVEQLLVANIDNLGARMDPVVLGAHLSNVRGGSELSVEVVTRKDGDRGGCVAHLEGIGPAIVEAFRLPAGTSMDDYPHFNTNSLWFDLRAFDRAFDLEWFAVQKQISTPQAQPFSVTQFERLIGQATEFVPTSLLELPRALRFVPVKTRDDLARGQALIAARVADPDAFLL